MTDNVTTVSGLDAVCVELAPGDSSCVCVTATDCGCADSSTPSTPSNGTGTQGPPGPPGPIGLPGPAGRDGTTFLPYVFRSTDGTLAPGASLTLSGGYFPGSVEVFRNGVLQVDGTDFTATDGTTIVPNPAAADADVFIVWANREDTGAGTPGTPGTPTTPPTSSGDPLLRVPLVFSQAAGNLIGGQTAFTVAGGYEAGALDVLRNGLWQNPGTDFTATDGNAVTLAAPVTVADTVTVIVYPGGSVAAAPLTDWASITGKPTLDPIATAGLPNVGTAGTYGGGGKSVESVTLDAKGRVSAVTLLTVSTTGGTTTVPAPTTTTRGGVFSAAAPANKFQTGIDTTGAPTFAQPAIADVSGLSTQLGTLAPKANPAFSGTATFGGITATGAATLASATTTGNVGIGGTLSVTGGGASFAGTVSAPGLTVTGATSLGGLTTSGTGTLAALSVTGNAGVNGSLTVSSGASLQSVTAASMTVQGILVLGSQSIQWPTSRMVFAQARTPTNNFFIVTDNAGNTRYIPAYD